MAITLAALWMHLAFLTHAGGLWRDEVNLVNLSALPSLAGLSEDSFPILMPLLVRGWCELGLGATDLELRVLGVLIGIGLLGAFWAAAWVMGRLPPLLAMGFMALNATTLVYGDSLRAYGLGSLLIVLAMAGMWAFLVKPTLGRATWVTALMVASVQTLFHNAVLVAALCLGGWVVCARRRAWRPAALILGAGLAAAASLLPYLGNFVSALEPSAGWRTGFRPWFTWLDLQKAIGFPSERYVWAWVLFALAALASGVAHWFLGRRSTGVAALHDRTDQSDRSDPADPTDARQTRGGATSRFGAGAVAEDLPCFAAVTLGAALVGFGGFLWRAGLTTQPWYFLPALALTAACFDAALGPLGQYFRAAWLGFSLVTAALALPLTRLNALSRMTNVDVVAHQLTARAGLEDFVVVSPWFCGISFARYYHGPAPWSTVPPLADHRFHRFDVVAAQLGKKEAIEPVLERMRATLQAGHYVWWVGQFDMPAPGRVPPGNLPLPPLEGSGWSQTPYTINWDDQVGSCLESHGGEFGLIKIEESGDVNPTEELRLARAGGWK